MGPNPRWRCAANDGSEGKFGVWDDYLTDHPKNLGANRRGAPAYCRLRELQGDPIGRNYGC